MSQLTKKIVCKGHDWLMRGAIEEYLFPADWAITEYPLKAWAPLAAQEIEASLRAPFTYRGASATIAALARGKKSIMLLSDDLTRPTPCADFLPIVIKILHESGVNEEAISVMIAGGLHRPWTNEEMELKLGAEIVRRYRPTTHDGFNGAYTSIGVTPRGTEVKINAAVAQSDLIISVSTLCKHRFVYATGGSKIILPGVSCRETILANHKGMTNLNWSSEHKFGLCRADMDEAAKLVQQRADLVVIDMTINSERKATRVYVGDAINAFHEKVDEALGNYTVPFAAGAYGEQRKAEIGFFRMGFHSCDPLQMSRAITDWQKFCTVPVIIADCADQYYYDGKKDATWKEYLSWTVAQKELPNPALAHAALSNDWNILYSPKVNEQSVHQKRATMHVAHDWTTLINGLYAQYGAGSRIAFFPDASINVLEVR